jgi:hypothetical protein
MEQIELLPQQRKLDGIASQNDIYLRAIQDSITDAEHNTQAFEESMKNEQNAINTLNDKISRSQTAALAGDIGVSLPVAYVYSGH